MKPGGGDIGFKVQGVCTLLQVFDMPGSLAFYRDVLGFAVVQGSSPGDDCDWCLLRLGDAELMLNTQYEKHHQPAATDSLRVLGHADVTLYFGCQDLDAAYEHLRAHGIEVEPPAVRPYGMRQLSFKDPDGYLLCYQWPVD